MRDLDQLIGSAAEELRYDLEGIEAGPFEPKSSLAPRVALVAIALSLVAIGAFLFRDGGATGSIQTDPAITTTVRSEPATTTTTTTPATTIKPEPAVTTTVETEPAVTSTVPPSPADQVLVGALTAAEPNEYFMPLPGISAWNADESLLLVYRTGEGAPGPAHLIVEASTGRELAELNVTPADIEQLYWSPTDPNLLYFTEQNQLKSVNARTSEQAVIHTFEECDGVDQGKPAMYLAADGVTFGLLCQQSGQRTLLAFDLRDGSTISGQTQGDGAPRPSQSGEWFTVWGADGTISILDASLNDTGRTIDVESNDYTFVTDGDGREYVASARFDQAPTGTLVIASLDGTVPLTTIIGPETGYEYPPSGTQLTVSLVASSLLGVTVAGPVDDGQLAGRVEVVDLSSIEAPVIQELTTHDGLSVNGYWSTNFVSISPSGRYIAWSSDQGGPSVNLQAMAVP